MIFKSEIISLLYIYIYLLSSLTGDSVVPGYVIKKPDKELNHKLHRAVWNNKDDKVCQIIEERTGTRGKEKHNLLAVDKYDRLILGVSSCSSRYYK